MENESTLNKKVIKEEEIKLPLAIILSIIVYCIGFSVSFKESYGVHFSTELFYNPYRLFSHLFSNPGVLFDDIIRALGASLIILPIIHVGIASLSKSNRNSNYRRKIFIEWSIALIVIHTLIIFSSTTGL